MLIPWKLLHEERVQIGHRRLTRRIFRLPNGRVAEFDIKEEGPTVCAVALTPQRTVLLARQFRPGPQAIVLDLPGGAVEPGESPEEAMARELREETGNSGTLHYLGASFHCAYSTRISHTFVATDCRRISEPCPDAHEFIEVVEMSLDEFKAHVCSGQLTDVGPAYRALDWLGML